MKRKRVQESSDVHETSKGPKKTLKREKEEVHKLESEIDDENVLSDGHEELTDEPCHGIGIDSFIEHFEQEIPESLADKLLKGDEKEKAAIWTSSEVVVPHLGKAEFVKVVDSPELLPAFNDTDLIKMHVKQSLITQLPAANLWNTKQPEDLTKPTNQLSDLQMGLFSVMNSYKDLYYPNRTVHNGEEIRLAYCLHVLNHVLKTRSRIIAHNTEIEKRKDEVGVEYRDQGLTRPKVVIVVPFRDAAFKIVHLMAKLLSNEQCFIANKTRFESEYGGTDDKKKGLKSEDFELTFSGNIDDMFRIGISVAKKTLKLYSDFYSSDIIIASPVSLRMITQPEKEEDSDRDFLSSIEMLIFDQMDVFFMQNFIQVTNLMSDLHCVPKELHGADYFRVRMWSLNEWSKAYRQTIIFSQVTHPLIEAIFRRQCLNYSGKLKFKSSPEVGALANIFLPSPLNQIFYRINVDHVQDVPDVRFNFFVEKILPNFVGGLISAQTLVFFSSYFDFRRVKKYFQEKEKQGSGASFEYLSEYGKKGDVSRARQHFMEGKVQFILMTERFHFYYRYKIRGIQQLIFYDLPIYPQFYPEICNMIHDEKASTIQKYNNLCTVLFTKYDIDRLVQVVGFEKACQLISADKDVHTFQSG